MEVRVVAADLKKGSCIRSFREYVASLLTFAASSAQFWDENARNKLSCCPAEPTASARSGPTAGGAAKKWLRVPRLGLGKFRLLLTERPSFWVSG